MKKVITTHLQSVVFTIEEEAFTKLEKYLETVRKYFKNFDEAEDIVSDIELRIAEKFTTEVISPKHKVIDKADVESLIKSMGSVADIASESEDSSPEVENAVKRLHRNPDDMIVSGVASGIAAYLGIDPVIVRALFALTLFAGGSGFLVYLVLWAITPEAKTPTQKLEMTGSPLTLASLEKNLSETLDNTANSRSGFRRMIQSLIQPFTVLALIAVRLAKGFFVISIKLLGLFMIIASLVGLGAASVGAGTLAMNLHLQYFEPAVTELANVIPYHLHQILVWSGYVSSLIPLIIAFLLGLAFLLSRNFLTAKVVLPLIGLLILSGSLATLTMIRIMPDVLAKAEQITTEKQESFSSNLVEKSFELQDFSGLQIDQNTNVVLLAADEFKVVVTGPSAEVETMNLRVENGILITDARAQHSVQDEKICVFVCHTPEVTVTISMPVLDSLEIADMARINSDTLFISPEFKLTAEDAARASLMIESEQTTIETNDLARINLSGSYGTLDLKAEASSRIEMIGDGTEATISLADISRAEINGTFTSLTAVLADDSHLSGIEVLKAALQTSGISSVELRVTEELEVISEDSSTVRYSGSPITNISARGISTVESEADYETAE